jgi:cytochrome c oxidase subunit IV
MDTTHKPDFVLACTYVWLALIVLTGTTYFIGEAGMSGIAVMLTVIATAAVKVQMVTSYFMGLRRTRWLWRGILLGWLVLVTGLITVAYLSPVK